MGKLASYRLIRSIDRIRVETNATHGEGMVFLGQKWKYSTTLIICVLNREEVDR